MGAAVQLDGFLCRHLWRLCLGPFELERSGGWYGLGNFNISGGLVGGQLGYNWQTGPVVLGIETDADWMGVKGNTAGLGCVCPADGRWPAPGPTELGWHHTRTSWLRIRPLAALCHGRRRLRQHSSGAANWHLHHTDVSWTAGAGVEVGINRNWSAKVEYLHIDLDTATFMGAASGTSTLAVPVTNELVRAGVNYHW